MSKQALEKKLEGLELLRSSTDLPATTAELRKALGDRNNYFVSKAAALVAELPRSELIPDLEKAFDRFLNDPTKSDPQCWAKTAIAKALKDLDHRQPQVFLRGIGHVQMEPVWGGRQDSAATLRGTCALALVNCHLDDLEILDHLVDLLADREKPARLDGAMAIAQLGRPEGALLLRLKILCGDPEPEVIGQCFLSLLSLVAGDAVPFVRRFLHGSEEDIVLEAASALAQSREVAAVEVLGSFLRERVEHRIKSAAVLFLSASPHPEAMELLLSILDSESGDVALNAIRALAAGRFRNDFQARAAGIVAKRRQPQLAQAFEREFGAESQ